MKASALLIPALLFLAPGLKTHAESPSPVGINIAQPGYGFNVLPGATRRIFATVTNGRNNQVHWTVKSGSPKISSNSGSWIDVTAPPTGSACKFVGTTPTSGTQFTIQATSVDDGSKSAAITFNVCNAPTSISVVPFYRTLYANQPADVQSFIVGNVNDNVSWAITSQPTGGDGKLSDSTSRDTVFTANVAGRYHLTATSLADQRQTATAIMYVTGHAMPYRVTSNQTEPIDCSVDPAMLGKVYEVGPSQAFTRLQNVPFPTMAPGSTVRVHNEDKTGSHPTEYHEYIQISQQAKADQPFRICGVPDTAGNLPIIDGKNATGRADTSYYAYGYGLITLRANGVWATYPDFNGAEFVTVEGLHVRNARNGVPYTGTDGSSITWQYYAACVRIGEGHDIAVNGNELDSCSNGAYSVWNGNNDWGGSSLNHLWEGNYIHGSGNVGDGLDHQMYLQAWGQVVQFNKIDKFTPGSYGFNLKSRGMQDIIRYNYFGDGPLRDIDMVDVEDATGFMSFEGYVYNHPDPSSARYPIEQVIARQESYNSHFAYGNIYLNSTASWPIHFAYDHSPDEPARKGNLYWYNNTFYEKLCGGCDSNNKWSLFDGASAGGDAYPQTEYTTVQAFNNVVWMDNPAQPTFQWNTVNTFIGVGGSNVLPAKWGRNTMVGDLGDGWNGYENWSSYQNAQELALHITGFGGPNVQTMQSIPFDSTSWMLKNSAPATTNVPAAVCEMPVRFAYLPSLGFAVARTAVPNIGATDTSAQVSAILNPPAGNRRTLAKPSSCR